MKTIYLKTKAIKTLTKELGKQTTPKFLSIVDRFVEKKISDICRQTKEKINRKFISNLMDITKD